MLCLKDLIQKDSNMHTIKNKINDNKCTCTNDKSFDGCGDAFSMEHALDCRFDGLIGCYHNEVHDAIGDLASLVWVNVVRDLWSPVSLLLQMVHYLLICVIGDSGFLSLRH